MQQTRQPQQAEELEHDLEDIRDERYDPQLNHEIPTPFRVQFPDRYFIDQSEQSDEQPTEQGESLFDFSGEEEHVDESMKQAAKDHIEIQHLVEDYAQKVEDNEKVQDKDSQDALNEASEKLKSKMWLLKFFDDAEGRVYLVKAMIQYLFDKFSEMI